MKVDRKLKFMDSSISWPSETVELYEREIYKTMANDIMTHVYSCVYITGTSGIGKSLHLFYLMYELIQDRKRKNQSVPIILYKTRESENLLLLSNGGVQKSVLSSPVFQDNVPNFVLIDSVDVQTVDSQYGPHILVASNTKYFKEFQKRVDEVGIKGKKFYMDLLDER
jgi:Cdc6-like AAA superfamily ATPase